MHRSKRSTSLGRFRSTAPFRCKTFGVRPSGRPKRDRTFFGRTKVRTPNSTVRASALFRDSLGRTAAPRETGRQPFAGRSTPACTGGRGSQRGNARRAFSLCPLLDPPPNALFAVPTFPPRLARAPSAVPTKRAAGMKRRRAMTDSTCRPTPTRTSRVAHGPTAKKIVTVRHRSGGRWA